MVVVVIAQPNRERDGMAETAGIAALLHDLDRRSPAGFAIALHIRFTAPTYLFQTYPRRWLDHYSAQGFVLHDPTVRWALANSGHILWSELEAIDTHHVLDRAKDFGLMNGVAVSVTDSTSRSIASFARADRDYDVAEIDALRDGLRSLHRQTAFPGTLNAEQQRALTELSVRLTR